MIIRTGSIVSHEGALQWGAGKVLEVTDTKVTIQFSDGTKRKVAASHFNNLQPADAALYVPPSAPPVVLARPAARKSAKTK